jgi:hypothetical protein
MVAGKTATCGVHELLVLDFLVRIYTAKSSISGAGQIFTSTVEGEPILHIYAIRLLRAKVYRSSEDVYHFPDQTTATVL